MLQTLIRGFTRQLWVIAALSIREVKVRNGKHAFSQLFDLFGAVAYIVAHFLIFTYLGRGLLIGDSILIFLATGILPVLMFRAVSIRTAAAINSAHALAAVPFIEPIDYAIARAFMEMATFSLMFGLFFIMVALLGMSRFALPYDSFGLARCAMFIFLLGFAVGLCNSFIVFIFPLWRNLWDMLSRVQIFMSAVFFIPEYQPRQLKLILSYNPVMHIVGMFRAAFYPTYPTHLVSFTYVFECTAIGLIIGLMLERALKNHRATVGG